MFYLGPSHHSFIQYRMRSFINFHHLYLPVHHSRMIGIVFIRMFLCHYWRTSCRVLCDLSFGCDLVLLISAKFRIFAATARDWTIGFVPEVARLKFLYVAAASNPQGQPG